MNDLFMESLALQRIELMARLVASSDCSDDDKEVAISWLSELTSDLVTGPMRTAVMRSVQQK